jgi:hypothetical protein
VFAYRQRPTGRDDFHVCEECEAAHG